MLAVAVSLALAAGARQGNSPVRPFVIDQNWVPIRIEHDSSGDVLHFRNGRRLALDFFEVKFLGQLPRSHRAPILILGARGCTECDIEVQVYAIPADANAYAYGERAGYYYPGTLSPGGGTTDTAVYYKGRLFIGRCLSDTQPIAVWFEQERDSIGQWHSNVYRLAVAGDSARGVFLQPMPPVSKTLHAVAAGKCLEIPGAWQVTL